MEWKALADLVNVDGGHQPRSKFQWDHRNFGHGMISDADGHVLKQPCFSAGSASRGGGA